MIVYGWNSKLLKEGEMKSTCLDCEHEGQLIAVHGSYAHVFWIPFFPYKKSSVKVCPNCQKVTESKHMMQEEKAQHKALRSATPFPKWMFSGLALVAVLIVTIGFTSYQSDLEKENFVANPKVGDVYNMKDLSGVGEYDYYFMKVIGIEDDSLNISPSESTYNMPSSKMLSGDEFLPISYNIHKSEVLSYSESGELIDIYRNYDESTGFNNEVEITEEMLLDALGVLEDDSVDSE
ncbi:MAG: hypothetical protein ACJAWV_002678 [Flammeovirgaceae bacterium]|jgi:hypothetical protein